MPCRASVARNSSCITSTSWSTRTSGSSTVALATAYSMILSAKSWRARSSALRSSRVLMSARSASRSAKSPSVPDEVVVELGQDLLAQLRSSTAKWAGLPGQLGLGVVVGERDVELGRVADLEADEVRLEARDQPLLAEDERHPLGRPALERLAVARPDERDDRVVAVLRAAVLDRGERRVLVAQLLDDLVDARVVDGLDLGPKLKSL